MKNNRSIRWIACLILFLAGSTAAQAQATRTWVSGTGDDAFPCSRTAPCKTFAGAINKTAAGGQINVMTPGSYGSVTIGKALTIDASQSFAGVLAGLGLNGILVQAGAGDVVVLRGLTFDGNNGTAANGIRFVSGAALHVENCTIHNFGQKGISFEPSAASALLVKDTIIRHNTAGGVANGGGILIKPTGSGSVQASLSNVRLERNVFGLKVENIAGATGASRVTARNVIVSGSTNNGVQALVAGAGSVQINLDQSVSSNNGSNGIQSNGGTALIRLSNVTVTNNAQTGLLLLNGGQIHSAGNNRVAGNTPDGGPSATVGEV